MKTRTTDRGAGSSGGRAYRRAHGVFVGVDAQIGNRSEIGAENDARAMADSLAHVVATSATLVREQATRRAILATLEDAMQAASPGDLVIAYFGAHTLQRYDDLYLMPFDLDRSAFLSTTVSFRLASAVLGSVPNVKSLIILDSCHSGSVGFDMSRYRVGSESSLMVSSGPDEIAISKRMGNGKQHGVFTWALLSALQEWKDAEGPAWTMALIDWFDRAYTLTIATKERQNPLLLGTLSPNLILRACRTGDSGGRSDPEGPTEAPISRESA